MADSRKQALQGITGGAGGELWPLASPQASIWAEASEAAGEVIYNVADLFRLEGRLDAEALRGAIASVDAAADVFRLRIASVGDQPRQRLLDRPCLDYACTDFSAAGDPEAAAMAEAIGLCQRPFDLARGPLVRHRLLRLAPDRHLLLRVFHHLVIDGWSGRVMANAVGRAYAALAAGRSLPEPELGTYLDFVAADAAYAGTPAHAADATYWRQRLASQPRLASFAPGPSGPPRRLAPHLRRRLPAELEARLAAAAAGCGASFQALLLAAFLALLGRAARDECPACQVALLNRRGRRERATIGPFLSLAAQGLDLGRDRPFAELAAEVGRQQRADFRHARLTPHHRILAGMEPWSGGGQFGAVFNAMDFTYDLEWPDLRVEYEMVSSGPVPDIALILIGMQRRQATGGTDLYWQYNPDRHHQGGVARLAERYEAILAAVAADPAASLSRLPLIGPEETAVIRAWEAGPALPPGCGQSPVQALVWRQAQAAPAAVAVESGQDRLTYAELTSLAAALAARLTAAGVEAETPVGLCLGASPALAAAFLGILASGGAVTPLDPALPPARLAAMAQGVGVKVVAVHRRTRGRISPELAGDALVIDLDELAPAPWGQAAAFVPAAAAGEQLACIFHTSGSTGRPKPVGVTHAALAGKIESIARLFEVGSGEVVCAAASIAFDPILQQVFIPLVHGGRIWFPGPTLLVDPPAFWRECAARGVTHLNLVPSMLEQLLEEAPAGGLPALRRLVMGGERQPPELGPRAAALLGVGAVWNMYGPTEATVDATGWRVDVHDAPAEVPIGFPLPGYVIRLLDDDLRRAPVGAAGQLCIGGIGLARGYLGMAEATRQKFIPDPYGPPGARLYLSGDYANWREDGAVVFIGRCDDQVKVRGQRIELGEVEAALRRQPGVRQAVVCHQYDNSGGRLTAYWVGEADPADLRRALAARLPRAAVPEQYVRLAALPLMPSGKADRRALAQATQAASAAPPSASAPAPAGASATLGRAIAAVWAELLGRAEIDVTANLFEIGAHSLLVPKALKRLKAVIGREVAAVDLMRHPSVASFAAFIAGGAPQVAPARPASRADKTGREGDVAIVGMALRLPGTDDRESFWANLTAGVESVADLDRAALAAGGLRPALLDHPGFVARHGSLADYDHFDPAPFGYAPGEAREMDPQQRLLLELAWTALEEAGCDPGRDGPVGAFVGVGFNTYLLDNLGPRLAGASQSDRYGILIGNDKDYAPLRLAYKLGLTGPAVNVNAACSTGLVAVVQAVGALRAGLCRAALAGGASLGLRPAGGYVYTEGGIASRSGRCRPFDAQADGTVPGSGAALVLLKRLADAIADGDVIHAVIRGVGLSNDGSNRLAFTAPSVDGQAAALAMALADAGVEPASIGFVEGHGTGTALGDPIEVKALNLAYAGGGQFAPGSILLGSLKGNLGHLDAAAGVAGLIKAALALAHGRVPPTCHYHAPNPAIDFAAGPFRVNAQTEAWPQRAVGQPRRAAVSSFGVGGTNAHVVLEQAPPRPAPTAEDGRPRLLAISAAGEAALTSLAEAVAAALPGAGNLADAAHSLARRRPLDQRLAVVAGSLEDAAVRLRDAKSPGRSRGRRRPGGVSAALLFPGQGSQHPGMGRDLYRHDAWFRAVVERAEPILAGTAAAGLAGLILAEPDDPAAAARLTDTAVAQPALFVVEYALSQTLMAHGIRPEALAGHSIGEYVAACLAGVMDFDAALALVAERGRLMSGAQRGAMLALALGEDDARRLLETGGDEVSLAVVNGPRQCVAAGPEAAIAGLEAAARALGRPAHRLAVSHAFHCALMEPILADFASAVARVDLSPPAIPCLSNLNGGWLTAAEATDPGYWARHLRHTVRFADNLALLLAEPGRILVEAGPGAVLSRLARANGASAERAVATQPEPGQTGKTDGRASLLAGLGALWTNGVDLDWDALFADAPRRRVPLPTYPFQRVRLWVDPPGPDRECGSLDEALDLAAPAPAAASPAGQPPALDAVLTAWREVFGLPGIGEQDDFFALGGDSLLALRIAGRLSERMGLKVSVGQVFAAATPAALAASLTGRGAAQPPAVAAAREAGEL